MVIIINVILWLFLIVIVYYYAPIIRWLDKVNSPKKVGVRWLLALLCSVGVYLALIFILSSCLAVVEGTNSVEDYQGKAVFLVYLIVGIPLVVISVGTGFAPRHKRVTCIILGIVSSIAFIGAWNIGNAGTGNSHPPDLIDIAIPTGLAFLVSWKFKNEWSTKKIS
jgi:hypothetical protein